MNGRRERSRALEGCTCRQPSGKMIAPNDSANYMPLQRCELYCVDEHQTLVSPSLVYLSPHP